MKQLSEFESLEQAREYPHTATRMMSADMFVSTLGEVQEITGVSLLKMLERLEATDDKASITLKRMYGNGEFNFIVGNAVGDRHIAYLDKLAATNAEESNALGIFKSLVIGYCNYETTPYASATLQQFNRAKGFKSESNPIDWPVGGVVTVTVGLPERGPVELWAVRAGREPKNIGRTEYLESGLVDIYVGDVRRKYPNTQIIASVPFADLEVSVI